MNDALRLKVLREIGLLDTPPEPAFDRLTALLAQTLCAPAAWFSLVEDDRQFFKSVVGLSAELEVARQTPLSHSFCKHVVASGDSVSITDARADVRTRESPAIADYGIVAYAGAPVRYRGQVLGALCVGGDEARVWTDSELSTLETFAVMITTELELRAALTQRTTMLVELATREAALRESELCYRLAASAAQALVWSFDIARQTVDWASNATCFGYPSSALGADVSQFLDRVHPEDRHVAATRFQPAASYERRCVEYRFRAANDEYALVEDHVRCLRDERGSVQKLIGAMHDVTERRALEHKLQVAQKMEVVGRLVSNVAHDFNSIFAALSVSIESARLPDASPEDVSESLQEMDLAVQRAAMLTRRLLAAGQRQRPQLSDVDVGALVQASSARLQQLLGEQSTLLIELQGTSSRVRVDPLLLEQVLVNLAVNARDAMPRGGVLTIRTASVEHSVVLTVSDTGCGMDVATATRAFEPFFTTKENGKGSGLGLATVRSVVEQFGGTTSVRSAVGEGTTIAISLPRLRLAEGAGEVQARGDRPGEHVLLVDDEAPLRTALRRALTRRGYKVTEACDGAEALALLTENPDRYDVVVSDVVMPLVSGLELSRRMRELGLDVPVVLMSGYPGETIGCSSSPGAPAAHVLLAKPFSMSQLTSAIRDTRPLPSAQPEPARSLSAHRHEVFAAAVP